MLKTLLARGALDPDYPRPTASRCSTSCAITTSGAARWRTVPNVGAILLDAGAAISERCAR